MQRRLEPLWSSSDQLEVGHVLSFRRHIGSQSRIGRKAMGLRTHMLVSQGAALFVLITQQTGMSDADISRVIQGVVSGIGCISAEAILRGINGEEVRGMAAAAGIWLTAGIGIAVALGREA
jgi:putative Mg2+ transporter-C (MgtC) family protein